MDVKSAFLNGDLKKEIYMYQPQGFQVPRKEHLICKLKKDLYGLRQAPRAWYIDIGGYLDERRFQRSPLDSNMYVKSVGNDIIVLVIYVYDIIITGSEVSVIEQIKYNVSRAFEMTDLGLLHHYLGVEVWQTCRKISSHRQNMPRVCLTSLECKIAKSRLHLRRKG
jgi:hypothetical protein